MAIVQTETRRDPVEMIVGNERWYWTREITTITDIRDTPFGPVNFGSVIWGAPTRHCEAING